jgi:3-oxoacyl-[acyl-carrier-protein] synthase II
MAQRGVVVTGVGAICAVGNSVPEVWRNIVAGCSGVAGITRFDPEGFETRFAAEVKGFDAAEAVGRKESRRMDRYTQFAVAAALEALAAADFAVTAENATRVGVLIGTGMGGMETFEQGTETVLGRGPKRLTPFFVPMMLANMASGTVSIAIGAKGPNFAPVSACAASAHAIGEATRMIRGGLADVMIAGGGEAPVTRMGVAGFNAMDALSTRNDDPPRASRPFDADRDGFVLGEGGAVLVLEAREHAEARGATVLGEVAGYATTDDANHMVQPAPGGEGAARAMQLALADAGLTPAHIDYVNAHGTSTQLNEKLETQALQRVFGDRTKQVPVSSTKSMSGHLLGAAGALEAVICLQALATGIAPPTINQERPDPTCDLDTVPNQAREVPMRTVMSNSMGFGGHNVSLILTNGSNEG